MGSLAQFGRHRRRGRPIFASRKRRLRRADGGFPTIVASALVATFALAVFIFVTVADDRIRPPRAADDPADDPVHVHGLGVNPADGALLIATHTGLFRTPEGETTAQRVTDRRQDTMGFMVVGPDRFLGSGHPDVREMRTKDLPPHLGLIESTDAGESWEPVSLLGQADFHVLRSAGGHVYGFDATSERLLVSRDGGVSWSGRALPGRRPLFDLAAHPENVRRVVATTELGLFESRNEGRTWRLLDRVVGLLDWPTGEHLYLVTGTGEVRTSADGGRTWRQVGTLAEEPAAFLAISADELYVALHDGTVRVSTDGGASWFDRSVTS
jgi:hypothetical protein